MAIILEEEKKKMNWMVIGSFCALATVTLSATYYLFFAPSPFIEVIIPVAIKDKSEIADIKLDISDLEESPTISNLRTKVNDPDRGTLGRPNPFLAF